MFTAATALARAGGLRHDDGQSDGGEHVDRQSAAEQLLARLHTEDVAGDHEADEAATPAVGEIVTILRRKEAYRLAALAAGVLILGSPVPPDDVRTS
jgi:hypothetical protein